MWLIFSPLRRLKQLLNALTKYHYGSFEAMMAVISPGAFYHIPVRP